MVHETRTVDCGSIGQGAWNTEHGYLELFKVNVKKDEYLC